MTQSPPSVRMVVPPSTHKPELRRFRISSRVGELLRERSSTLLFVIMALGMGLVGFTTSLLPGHVEHAAAEAFASTYLEQWFAHHADLAKAKRGPWPSTTPAVVALDPQGDAFQQRAAAALQSNPDDLVLERVEEGERGTRIAKTVSLDTPRCSACHADASQPASVEWHAPTEVVGTSANQGVIGALVAVSATFILLFIVLRLAIDSLQDTAGALQTSDRRRAAAIKATEDALVAKRSQIVRAEIVKGIAVAVREPLDAIFSFIASGPAAQMDASELRAVMHEVEYAAREVDKQVRHLIVVADPDNSTKLHFEDLPVAMVINDVYERFYDMATLHGNHFTLDCPDHAGLMRVDALKLEQVLARMVRNSADATEDGDIRLIVRIPRSSSGPERIQFEVVDDRPSQAAALLDEDEESGGLATARWLSDTLGGSLTVTQSPSGGARLSLDLPRDGDTNPTEEFAPVD